MVAMRAIVGMRINIRDANTAYTDFLVLNPYPCGFTGASARQIQKQAMFAKKSRAFRDLFFCTRQQTLHRQGEIRTARQIRARYQHIRPRQPACLGGVGVDATIDGYCEF